MDWEKVKRIFIYLLLALNVSLLGVNYFTNRVYTITASQEKSIYRVMADSGVAMYTELIKKTPPMRSLSVAVTSLDPEYYKKMFFAEDEDVKITLEFDKTILASNNKSLTIQGNNIVFLNNGGTGKIDNFTKETALDAANKFLVKIDQNTNEKLKLENIEIFGDRYIFEYNERYKGYKLFSNVKKVTVSESGIVMVSAAYYTAQNFVGEKKEIVSCDEALLSFLGAIKKAGITEGVYIEKIELGYDFQAADDVADGSSIRLVPCYRIYTSGYESTYTINAYTNEIME